MYRRIYIYIYIYFSVVCLCHIILFRFFCRCVRICFYLDVNIFCIKVLKEEHMFWASDINRLAKVFGLLH